MTTEYNHRSTDKHIQELQTQMEQVQSDTSDIKEVLANLGPAILELKVTFRVLGMVLIIILPIILTWNYFLGNSVTALKERVAVLEYIVASNRGDKYP